MLAYSDVLGGPMSHVAYCDLQDRPIAYVIEAHLSLKPIRREAARIKAKQERDAEDAKRRR